ncbi:MAG: hypothetical protein MZV64_49640 [Ignavibacteriales bacterium]|nr:hypothetical protein [Ignavibacteriales bacterium]
MPRASSAARPRRALVGGAGAAAVGRGRRRSDGRARSRSRTTSSWKDTSDVHRHHLPSGLVPRLPRRADRSWAVEIPGLEAKLEAGDSVAVNGVCLTLVARGPEELRFDLSRETLARTTLGRLTPGRPAQPRAAADAGRARSAGTSSAATSTASARSSASSPGRPGKRLTVVLPAALRPVLRRQGLGRGRRGQPDRRRRSARPRFEVELIPPTLARHEPRRPARRRDRQPRV